MDVSVVAATVEFGSTVAVADISLNLDRGLTALLGPNGAGKTTTLRVAATAQPLQRGKVLFDGADPTGLSAKELRHLRSQIGYLAQDNPLVGTFRAVDMVAYVGWLKGLTFAAARSRAVTALEAVRLGSKASRRCSTLSGGMRRRVGLACAIVSDPALLLLDEPTVGLDPEQRYEFDQILLSLSSDRCVVLSTHLVNELAALSPRTVVMRAGQVLFEGTFAELSQHGREHDEQGATPAERGYFHVLRSTANAGR